MRYDINTFSKSSTTSQVNVFEGPMVANGGNLLFQQREGTATTEATLGEFERNEEFILPTSIYILKFIHLPPVELVQYNNGT